MQIYGNKSNFLHEKSPTPKGFVQNCNMATVSLFWNTNMAAVKSCEYALYDYRRHVMDVKITQVEIGWNTPIPFALVLQFRYRCLL